MSAYPARNFTVVANELPDPPSPGARPLPGAPS